MLDFVLQLGPRQVAAPVGDYEGCLPDKPEHALTFSAELVPIAARLTAMWSSSHPWETFGERVRLDAKGLSLLAGYPLTSDYKPVTDVADFASDGTKTYHGDYCFLRLAPDGAVTLRKSPVCTYQLYYGTKGETQILASRASIAAYALGGSRVMPPVDPDFARWVFSYAISANASSVFAGISNILMNQMVTWDRERGLTIRPPDPTFLTDHAMVDLYHRNPKRYWDDVFDHFVGASAVLSLSDQPIDFPLSGGKDSRLLMAMLLSGPAREQLRSVFTNGPPVSPDVRSAAMVCQALGLKHDQREPAPPKPDAIFAVDHRLPLHAYLTEAEMSPVDLTWNRSKSTRIELHGQEGGLRNISEKRDTSTPDALLTWFRLHLSNGDKCGILNEGVAEQNMADIETYVSVALKAGIAPDDVPVLHRVNFRLGRWVARTWRIYNDRFFAPYLLVDHALIKATFNSGAKSRIREDFHAEMLRRFDPALMEIPFAGQSWEPETAVKHGIQPADPLTWPETVHRHATKNTFLAMTKKLSATKAFILQNAGPVTGTLVDATRFASLDPEKMHPSFHQALWQVMQIALIERVPSFEDLASGQPATAWGLPSFDI